MDPLVYNLLWIFGWVLVFLAVWLVRSGRRQRRIEIIHAERMAAIEKGLPLTELPDYEALSEGALRPRQAAAVNPRWPLGAGAICFMLGTGFSLALWLSGDHYHNQIWSFGLIGVFLGVGLMLHYLLMRPEK
jgi:hypothetical protein